MLLNWTYIFLIHAWIYECVAGTHSSCDGLILLEPVIYASRDDIAPIRPVAASLILWQEFRDMSGQQRHGTLLYYIHNDHYLCI